MLEVENLVVKLGNEVILEDVSFHVEPGRILTIVGPNGAGKSVLLKTLLGIIPKTSGVIKVQGREVENLTVNGTGVGYIPQRLQFDPTFPLTVRELMLLGVTGDGFVRSSPASLQEVNRALERVGALHLSDRRIGNLSGGELQRVLFAYSIAKEPQILLLDEPATGIDIKGEETFYSLLYQLHQSEQRTILMVTHDLNVVYRYADDVLCLNRRMMCSGPPVVLTEEVLRQTYGGLTGLYPHEHH